MGIRTRRGKPVVGQYGQPKISVPPNGPATPDMGESIWIDDTGALAVPVLVVPGQIPEEYAFFVVVWYGMVDGVYQADAHLFPAQTGPILDDVNPLGKFATQYPTEYQLMAIDSAGRPSALTLTKAIGVEPTVDAFEVTANPVLQAPCVAGEPMVVSAPEWTGDPSVTYELVTLVSEDEIGTGEVSQEFTGTTPDAVGTLDTVCVGAVFHGPGTSVDPGPHRSNRVAITPVASVEGTPPELALDEVKIVGSYYRYADKWRAVLARLPGGVVLTNNPFHFESGSAIVTINIPYHGMVFGEKFMLARAIAGGGITLSGQQVVLGVPDKDHITVNAGSNANATVDGGGSGVIFYRAQTAVSLGVDPFAFLSSLQEVTVSWPNHGAKVGKWVEFTGAAAGPGGLTLNSVYPVSAIVDANYFRINIGVNPSASTAGGGSSVVGTIRNHNQPFLLGANPLATTDGSTTVTIEVPNHRMAVGRPMELVGLSATGGISAANINGLRTVTAVPDSNHVSFTAGAGATLTVAAGGGSVGAVLPRWAGKQWSRNTPDPVTLLIADNFSEETPYAWQEYIAGSGVYTMFMENPANDGDPDSQNPRRDWSVYDAEAFPNFRFGYRETASTNWSWWTDAMAVPQVPVLVDPEIVENWIQISDRTETDYNNDDPGCYGVQFERVVACFKGTNPDLLGMVVYGQDENGVWISMDGGKTIGSKTIYGLYCSQMGGAYGDDDGWILVGNAFSTAGFNGAKPYAGCYIGDPYLNYAYRLNVTRTGVGSPAAGGLIQAFVRPMHGGSDRNWQNCVNRRPAAAGLNRAQRFYIIVENQQSGSGGDIIGMYVWKLVMSDVAEVASMTMLRSLPLSWANGHAGISTVEIAPNGDVVLNGPNGVYLSTDQFATQPTQIFSRACRSSKFFGGSATAVSGLIVGDNSSTGGVYRTNNVRTTAPTKPNGNSGLPAGYEVKVMGFNGDDTIAVTNRGSAQGYVSRNRGDSFSLLPNPKRAGEENFRYTMSGGNGPAAYAHVDGMPGNWTILTFQTMTQSDDDLATVDGKGAMFFDGHHMKGIGYSQNPDEWRNILKNCQDNAANTGDGLLWNKANGKYGTGHDETKAQIGTFGGGGEGYVVGAGGGLVANNYRLITGVTRTTGSWNCVCLVMEGRQADGAYTQHQLYNSGVASRMFRSDWSRKETGVGFLGRWCVSNANAANRDDIVWTNRSNEYIDHNMDGTTLVSFWGNHGVNSGTKIFRSTNDRGASQVDWFTVNYVSRAICMDHHHATLERVLYTPTNAKSTIWEIIKDGSTVVEHRQVVNLLTTPGGVRDVIEEKLGTGINIPAFEVEFIISHPNIAGRIYVVGGRNGHPNWWLTTDNGATWANISEGTAATIHYGFIYPPTGEIIAGNSLGGRILPVPEGSTGLAHENGLSAGLLEFYGRPTVTNPPEL